MLSPAPRNHRRTHNWQRLAVHPPVPQQSRRRRADLDCFRTQLAEQNDGRLVSRAQWGISVRLCVSEHRILMQRPNPVTPTTLGRHRILFLSRRFQNGRRSCRRRLLLYVQDRSNGEEKAYVSSIILPLFGNRNRRDSLYDDHRSDAEPVVQVTIIGHSFDDYYLPGCAETNGLGD